MNHEIQTPEPRPKEDTHQNGVVPRIRAQERAIVERWYDNQFDEERLKRFNIDGTLGRTDASEHFLQPMLGLLLAYLETTEPRYRDLYLDERLRFAPHRADPKVRRAFFEELLPIDEQALVSTAVSSEAQESLRGVLKELHAPLMESGGKDTIKLLAVGDCLLNEVRVFLRPRCALKEIPLDMRCAYFSASLGKDLSSAEVETMMAETRFDVIAFSFFTYDGLPPYTALLREADKLSHSEIQARVQSLLSLVEGYLTRLREKTDAPFLLHNVSGLPLSRYRKRIPILPALSNARKFLIEGLNEGLRQMADGIPNVLLLDEHRVANEFGLRKAAQAAVPSHLSRHAYFHTSRFGEPLADAYADILTSFRDLRKAKVLFLDFDNTLWEGVMADGEVKHRLEGQKVLRRLKDAGMLLVALSKNDPKNIRWEEMGLRAEDFALLKINWNLKAQSIQEAADELDLGIDSFVVVDDSDQERALIATQFPKLRTLDATKPETWTSLERLLRFPNTRDTEESRARTELYRAQAERRRAQSDAGPELDYPAMMASLGLRVRFRKASTHDLDRLTELVQRTNQFNTTTVRYTKRELSTFMSSPTRAVYTAEVVDKFGSFGLVAVVVLSRNESDVTFDSFVMSCRAMGFGLEQAFLRLILDSEPQATRAVGRFVPTDRNAPSARLFVDNGFRQTDDTTWLLDDGAQRPEVPSWITVEDRSRVSV